MSYPMRDWRVRSLTPAEWNCTDADLLYEAERGNLFVEFRSRLRAYMEAFPDRWTAHHDKHMGWICVHRSRGVWHAEQGGPLTFDGQASAELYARQLNDATLRMHLMGHMWES
jgi:hypothetical protein